MVGASRGVVASPHTLATRSGVRALERGGNAVDAAVAASATLAVVYPHMAGIGGDLFALVWSDREGVACLNASGRSARAASPEWYRARGLSSIPDRGPHAALTVPGTVAGWAELLSRHGRLGLAEALAELAGASDPRSDGSAEGGSSVRYRQG